MSIIGVLRGDIRSSGKLPRVPAGLEGGIQGNSFFDACHFANRIVGDLPCGSFIYSLRP